MSIQSEQSADTTLDIAVIGMAARFPGARDIDTYWQNLCNGIESIRDISEKELVDAGVDRRLYQNPSYVRRAASLDDVDKFDADFFGYSPREAASMDPQARIFLECAWHAMEDAGYDPPSCPGSVGVYAASSLNTYFLRNVYQLLDLRDFILSGVNLQHVIGNGPDFLATRVSHKLNLRGPSLDVQTACSSGLVAIHSARQSLLNGECDMALAGAVSVYLPQDQGYLYQEGLILSPDGRCRAFDKNANGTIFGRGVGVVVLKPLADALSDGDRIMAVIKGSAVNNDGANKASYTAPGVQGQSEVVAEAIVNAGIASDSISYVETHGTGTPQGDPIEIAALAQAFLTTSTGRASKQRCPIGSVKPNIGHLDAASGVASFIKVVLMLQNKRIPPSINYEEANREIDFDASPFAVNRTLLDWQDAEPRRAGVSAFGIGGTNAHVILEAAPRLNRRTVPDSHQVLTLSARSEAALGRMASLYATHLTSVPDRPLLDVCYSANTGRARYGHRLAVVGRSRAEIGSALAEYAERRSDPAEQSVSVSTVFSSSFTAQESPTCAFLFTGQGSQYRGMGKKLYDTHATFRGDLDDCDRALQSWIGDSIRNLLWTSETDGSRLNQTEYAQPALFVLEYCLARLWRSWGIEPTAMIGHSLGEYVAACLAGVFSFEDALKMVVTRARLMQALPEGGSMVAALSEIQAVRDIVDATQPVDGADQGVLCIAAVNGPRNIVVSGSESLIEEFCGGCSHAGIQTRRLVVSHAFHSPLVEPMLADFARAARETRFEPPQIPVISNVTGEVAEAETIASADYWVEHIRKPVLFAAGLNALPRLGCDTFIEIGPHPTLIGMGRVALDSPRYHWIESLHRDVPDDAQIAKSLARLYVNGIDVDWRCCYRDTGASRVRVPGYPFERQRHWIEAGGIRSNAGSPSAGTGVQHPLLDCKLATPDALIFQGTIDIGRLPYLGHHTILGKDIFPATGYIELAQAAVRSVDPDRNWSVSEFQIDDALILDRIEPVTVQVILRVREPSGFAFEVHSRPDKQADAWKLHAKGSLEVAAGAVPEPLARNEVRSRCAAEQSGRAYYGSLESLGLQYGELFRGIEQVRSCRGESFAEIRCPALLLEELGNYNLHPALLDACLQSVFAAMPAEWLNQGDEVFLPTGVDAIHTFGPLSDRLWSHVRLHSAGGQRPRLSSCDVVIFNDRDEALVQFAGIRLQRTPKELLETRRPGDAELLFHVDWRSEKLPLTKACGVTELQSPSDICTDLASMLPALRTQYGMEIYDRLEPQLDRLCSLYVQSAVRDLGWHTEQAEPPAFAQLSDTLGVVASQRRMFGRMVEILVEDGVACERNGTLRLVGDKTAEDPEQLVRELLLEFPECKAKLDMLRKCGRQLAAVMAGEVDPLQLLFSQGSIGEIEAVYRTSPFTYVYNDLVKHAIEQALSAWPRERRLRVLEIGAGTGGTTRHVLAGLPAANVEYLYTDVSSLFLTQAAENFRDYPFIDYRILDIGGDPMAQGFKAHAADLVVASNVLHATRDLRRTMRNVRHLMSPDGLLVMVEGVARQRWVDLIFGLTEGWWLFEDTDLRPTYPLISQRDWKRLLLDLGFDDFSSLPAEGRETDLFRQAVLLARAPGVDEMGSRESRESANRQKPAYLILADESGLAAELARRMNEEGAVTALLFPGTAYCQHAPNRFTVRPQSSTDVGSVLECLRAQGIEPTALLSLWPLDSVADRNMTDLALANVQEQLLAGTLHLLQALLTHEWQQTPRLVLVTRGAQAIGDGNSLHVSQAPLAGMARVIAVEHPELKSLCIDLDPCPALDEVGQLLAELANDDPEAEIAYRNGERMVPLLQRVPSKAVRPPGQSLAHGSFRLLPPTSHLLDDLRFEATARRQPAAGEVEIQIATSGLNFKDALLAMGMYPGDREALGGECAGRIVNVGEGVSSFKPGDAVVAFSPGSIASYLTVDARFVTAKPEGISFEEAAAFPGAFLTAHYSLVSLAKVARGDKVLIHAGSGGVGMAAIQVAQRAGAEIFATAGSPHKRALLSALGVKHVMDSRSTAFADEILQLTDGHGVDVVLNCLSGEFIDASMRCTARGGRFVELGKRGIWSAAQVAELDRCIDYFTVDVAQESQANPEFFGQLLTRLAGDVAKGLLRPLPTRVFPMEDIASALRFMAQAKHTGKLCVSRRHWQVDAERTIPERIAPQATYLITGGLGGLGLATARWLAGRGARHLVLMGRSDPGAAARQVIDELERQGVQVRAVRGDVAISNHVERALAGIDEGMPPLRGIVHAAGTLADGMLLQQTWENFRKVLGAKVSGAWNLHRLTEHLPLDFFVLYSSVASLVGTMGQANHVAANAFLDVLAHWRRGRGLPAVSINWGAWSDIGAVTDEVLVTRLLQRGMRTITPAEGIELLETALARNEPQIAAVAADWPVFLKQYDEHAGRRKFFAEIARESARRQKSTAPASDKGVAARRKIESAPLARRRTELQRFVTQEIKAGLGIDAGRSIGLQESLADIGVDSLMAVELRHRLSAGLALEKMLPATLLFDYPTIGSLTEYLAREVLRLDLGDGAQSNNRKGATDGSAAPADIDRLSDEEAEALLLQELDAGIVEEHRE